MISIRNYYYAIINRPRRSYEFD